MLPVKSNKHFFSWLYIKVFQRKSLFVGLLVGLLLNIIMTPVLFSLVHHFGRAVIMFGVPYVYTQSRILKVRTFSVAVDKIPHSYHKMHLLHPPPCILF